MLLCVRFKGWEGVGEKMGSAKMRSADGETVTRDHSPSVAELSSESGPMVGLRSDRGSLVSPASMVWAFINVCVAPRSQYQFQPNF